MSNPSLTLPSSKKQKEEKGRLKTSTWEPTDLGLDSGSANRTSTKDRLKSTQQKVSNRWSKYKEDTANAWAKYDMPKPSDFSYGWEPKSPKPSSSKDIDLAPYTINVDPSTLNIRERPMNSFERAAYKYKRRRK